MRNRGSAVRACLGLTALLTAAIGLGSPAGAAGVEVASSGITSELNCAGKAAQVSGSDNRLTILGDCSQLEVFGSNNRIAITLARGATVQVFGSNNDVTWSVQSGAPPKIEAVGSANAIRRRS